MRTTRTAVVLAVMLSLPACQRSEPGPGVLPEDGMWAAQRCNVPEPPAGVETVQVVFSCDELAVGTWRRLQDTPGTGPADTLAFALAELLQGPTLDERDAGLSSFFSDTTRGMLNDVRVSDGVAYVDFRDFSRLIPNASTSAGSNELLDQLAGTIFQFDAIREAEITFGGSCDAFWNWIQRDCERLTRSGP